MDSFGADRAATYDDTAVRGDEDHTVAFLAQEARGGPALELAIGTGRIALPLAASGVRVDGIDMSPHMIAQLRAKPDGPNLRVVLGDFADVPIDGTYRLIYLVYNTLYNLLTQDEQVRCFTSVAEHLTDDGVFVVEGFTPDHLYRLRDGQYVDAEQIDTTEVKLDIGQHDPVAQLLDESHLHITASGIHLNPLVSRYVWPSELDLMARLAGLHRTQRWSDWQREPFTDGSRNCISVYAR